MATTRGSSVHSAATRSEASEPAASVELLTPGSDLSSVGPSQKTSPDQDTVEEDNENTRTNAEIMETLQRAKVTIYTWAFMLSYVMLCYVILMLCFVM